MSSSRKWDLRFMKMAKLVSSWSKDTTKVGAVIVGPHREVRSLGYNGFPRGVDDSVKARGQRPLKYLWTEHAERNAIFNASLSGVSLAGCTMYLNGDHGFPCAECARAIIQCGIKALIGLPPNFDLPKYAEEYRNTILMFQEAGVAFRSIRGEIVCR